LRKWLFTCFKLFLSNIIARLVCYQTFEPKYVGISDNKLRFLTKFDAFWTRGSGVYLSGLGAIWWRKMSDLSYIDIQLNIVKYTNDVVTRMVIADVQSFYHSCTLLQ